MPPLPAKQANDDVAPTLRRVQKTLARLATTLDRLVDLADEAASELEKLQKRPVAELAESPARHRRTPVRDLPVLIAEAESGAFMLRVTATSAGPFDVSINGRRSFRLSPQLGAFLRLIALAGREADDGLIGWRSKSELALALRKETSGHERPADVPRIVHRLRRAFEAAGENVLLIQTNRARGVRFALRARPAAAGATEGDPR